MAVVVLTIVHIIYSWLSFNYFVQVLSCQMFSNMHVFHDDDLEGCDEAVAAFPHRLQQIEQVFIANMLGA